MKRKLSVVIIFTLIFLSSLGINALTRHQLLPGVWDQWGDDTVYGNQSKITYTTWVDPATGAEYITSYGGDCWGNPQQVCFHRGDGWVEFGILPPPEGGAQFNGAFGGNWIQE